MEQDAGFRASVAGEVQTLPDGSAVVEMLADYAVMRESRVGLQVAREMPPFRHLATDIKQCKLLFPNACQFSPAIWSTCYGEYYR